MSPHKTVLLVQIRFLNRKWAQRLCCFFAGFNSHWPVQLGQLLLQMLCVYGRDGQDYYPGQVWRKTAGVLERSPTPRCSREQRDAHLSSWLSACLFVEGLHLGRSCCNVSGGLWEEFGFLARLNFCSDFCP